ncbi:Transcriptional regulatory protein LnrK [Pseudoalteromonas holothuriae]|uniref:Transcriptional regulatory protein LnrK n=1 Tax=Pseudoalteromonas holothuriae TaxID=2963714 RepID=A0A9W4QUA3_9GAMM|nr:MULTISPECIES: response regulator transcription factor [unclassified Pseudoalteromonas]CAH9053228.1 Transcriptional regulatory protein LnrK [Pseudoalteromonas sp. CIP111854]CAH9061554.1 Transcriptional regulatory protein LnrK [Pseudoalteromonas sp. CIP111951]
MNKIKIHLVDDQSLIRQGMRSLLQLTQNISVTGESSSGNAFLQLLSQKSVDADIVLLDMRMEDGSGLDVLNAPIAHQSQIKFLILTTFNENNFLLGGMEAGASGYLLKDVSLEELVDAIERVQAGEIVLQNELTQQLLKAKRQPVKTHMPLLTDREIDILKLMVSGLSNKEIAAKIFKAEGTVRNHVSNILSKLEVRDRTQAILKTLEMGLLNQD